ncbi:MAG: SMC-Scp complex subunit ScpB [Planctomycetia bacterium TMED53]|nr:MAG: SMC-Scp complex subunit ScpB [Planctomycetia bacterium TMED53]
MISREEEGAPAKTNPAAQEVDSEEEGVEIIPLEGDQLRSTIEAILFASPEPVSRRRLQAMLKEAPKGAVREALLEMEAEYLTSPRGFLLHEDGAGIRLLSKPDFAPYVARLRGEGRRIRLSSAAFETLAVIAYRQPVKRSDLEQIRGVSCGPILKNLMEWNLIRITGQDESVGRPLLYGTTTEFLELFGLSELDGLPEPSRLKDQGSDRGLEILDEIIRGGEEADDRFEAVDSEKSENSGDAESADSPEAAPIKRDRLSEGEETVQGADSAESPDFLGDDWIEEEDGSP